MVELEARGPLAGRSFRAGPIAIAEGVGENHAGLAFIAMSGPGILDLLAITALAEGDEGTLTTRLADLRVTIAWHRTPAQSAQIAVDRFSADYLWHWLTDKMQVENLS